MENKKIKIGNFPKLRDEISKEGIEIIDPEEIEFDHEVVMPELFKYSIIYKELDEDVREKLKNLAGKGALLYGFPGTGKGTLVKLLAKENNAYIIQIHKEMPVMAIREAFDKAREIARNNKVFVVIDEIDDFGTKEYSRYSGGISKIIALMTELDGIKGNREVIKNLYLFGLTNYKENVDERLLRPGRLEEILEIPLPTKEERARIYETIVKEIRDGEKLGKYKELVAKKTNGYTPADIRGLVKRLAIKAIEKGEIDENSLFEVINSFNPTVKRGVVNFEDPKIKLEDIVGRELYIDFFKEILKQEKNANATFLLYGPRGVGKTIFPEALASYFEYNFIKVKASELQEGIVGEGTKNLKRLFNYAKLATPCILLIDELEGIITKRGTISHKDDETSYFNAVVGDLLREKDGLYLFATTNDPLLINDTTLARFQYKVAFELPNEKEREEYFKRYFNGKVNGFSEFAASITNAYSFRDLYFIVEAVNMYANEVNGNYEKLLNYVISRYKSATNQEDFGKIKEIIGDSLEIKKFVENLKNEIEN